MVRTERFTFSNSSEGGLSSATIESVLETHEDIRKWEQESTPQVGERELIYEVRIPDYMDSRRITSEIETEIEDETGRIVIISL